MSRYRLVLTTTGFWLGYVVLLVTVPRLWPPDSTLPSAAAVLGYDLGKAFLVAAGWSLLGLLAFAFAAEMGMLPRVSPDEALDRERSVPQERGRKLEIVAAFVVFSLAYFPGLSGFPNAILGPFGVFRE